MAELPKRVLGRTGFAATILGYGAMELRGAPGGPKISDDDARKVLNAVLDAGINLIDTSIDYGHSEELIGRYIAQRRSEYFLKNRTPSVLTHTRAAAVFISSRRFRVHDDKCSRAGAPNLALGSFGAPERNRLRGAQRPCAWRDPARPSRRQASSAQTVTLSRRRTHH
jgi:hypothetical protein